ncbi:MAG: TetR/AcrR family transcriptional regulator, partial [Myxococcales bacterium]
MQLGRWAAVSSDAEILEAALAQFADTGVRRTSIDDIAQRAGINRVTLYRRFGSREQIVHAAYLQEAARVLGLIDAEAGLIPT